VIQTNERTILEETVLEQAEIRPTNKDQGHEGSKQHQTQNQGLPDSNSQGQALRDQ
jgi:hypothetical protein